ncbi:complement factor H-like isoform X4 [Acipenser ruthenus]|uniref:complement factor H-like isoform X4 n=1 Tax=Acipenser ruthenus TaxID=7906 RepID=UPI002740DF70|nr:complement factor H-like isoform X4 [Acipenser ruthenus]
MEKIHLVLFLATWSASVISQTQACNTPPVVDNAFISENEKIGNYSEGDIVYYTCHPGYISRGRLRYKCQDEEWTQSRLLKCTPKPCGHPGDIINGRFHLVNNTEFLYGVQVKYTCNEGYQMASQMDFRVCLDNGWSNDVPHCEVKTCIPQKPEAGIIITSGKFESDEPIPYGNVLKFECSSSDFTIDGESEVHCKADGNWSSPFPTCKELKCPSPPNILHGRLVEASENEYAHDRKVTYQCDQFYQIQGSTFIRCIHGTWSIPPSCIGLRPTCGPPPAVDHAEITHGERREYEDNDWIRYRCHQGYGFEGSIYYSTCRHGKWSDAPKCISLRPTCGPPPAVDHAEITHGERREYEDNNWIRYQCHQGYGFEGSIYYSICRHGKWSDAPKCISLRPTCGPPPAVDHAEITHGERREYEDNNWIRYQCHQGYGFEGSIYYSICRHGKWSDAPKCISLRPTCGPPPAVNNAVILRGERREYRDSEVIEYRCNLGYEFEGSNDYNTCRHGTWSDAPKCISLRPTCGPPPAVDHAEITHGERREYEDNDWIRYRCHQGYGFEGSIYYSTCRHGKWSDAPKCISLRPTCGPPPAVDHAEITHGERREYEDNNWIRYQCHQGYGFEGSIYYSICRHGKWSDAPKCISLRPTCGPPPAVDHAEITHGERREYEDNNWIRYQCHQGYGFEGSIYYSICRHGKWSDAPKCISLRPTCGPPPAVNNAVILRGERREYRDSEVIEYRCNLGYEFEGSNDYNTCRHGTWSDAPKCISLRPTCGPPPAVDHAEITHGERREYEDNDWIRYRCHQGYGFEGSIYYSTCRHGKWSDAPKCISLRPTCGPPPAVDHAEITHGERREYEDNNWIRYQCHQGYGFEGSIYYSICRHGKWSDAPKCISLRPTCGPPPAVDHAEITHGERREYEDNNWIRYQCHQGYGFEGSIYYSICRHGKWSDAPKCISLRPTCGPPPAVNNAVILRGERREYRDSEVIEYRCNLGYEFEGSNDYNTCRHGTWSDAPKCISLRPTCGPPPAVDHAEITQGKRREYEDNDWIRYQCHQGYGFEGSIYYSTCRHGKWSDAPKCISSGADSGSECGPPPVVDNAVIEQRLKTSGVYQNGDTMKYQCQSFYVLEGSNQARCNRGTWESLPICLEPCTVTDSDMEQRNIMSRWSTSTNFIKHNDIIEFTCTYWTRLRRDSGPLRIRCNNGRLDLPICNYGAWQK